MKSSEKWKCDLKISKVSEGVPNEDLSAYLIAGVMNKNQVETMENRMTIHSNIRIEKDKFAIASLVTHAQLQSLFEKFLPLSKSWRGQYQSLAKEFVRAYQEQYVADS